MSAELLAVLVSDLGTEEDPQMLLNTFSGYDMEIADLSQIGANAERARTTSCSTSRTPGPSQARRCQPRCHRSTRAEARVCLAAVRGGTDNFTDFTDVIAAEMKGGEHDGTRMAVGAEMTPRLNPSVVCS